MKCLKILSENNEVFELENIQENYNYEDFTRIKLVPSDIKTLSHIFEISEAGESIGIFPDAISDAYDYNLIDDEEDENLDESEDY